jgi:hypothetical protein
VLPPSQHASAAAADRDRKARAASRKAGITRRTLLGVAAAGTVGLAVTGWELSRNTTTPRHTSIRPRSGPRPGTLKWTTTIPNHGIGWGPAVLGDIIYVGDIGNPTQLYALTRIRE